MKHLSHYFNKLENYYNNHETITIYQLSKLLDEDLKNESSNSVTSEAIVNGFLRDRICELIPLNENINKLSANLKDKITDLSEKKFSEVIQLMKDKGIINIADGIIRRIKDPLPNMPMN